VERIKVSESVVKAKPGIRNCGLPELSYTRIVTSMLATINKMPFIDFI